MQVPFQVRVRVLLLLRACFRGMWTRTTHRLYERAISYSAKASGCRVLLDTNASGGLTTMELELHCSSHCRLHIRQANACLTAGAASSF